MCVYESMSLRVCVYVRGEERGRERERERERERGWRWGRIRNERGYTRGGHFYTYCTDTRDQDHNEIKWSSREITCDQEGCPVKLD